MAKLKYKDQNGVWHTIPAGQTLGGAEMPQEVVDNIFDVVNTRMGNVEGDISALNSRIDSTNTDVSIANTRINVTNTRIDGIQAEFASPEEATEGQVLTADGAGGSVWAEPTGGGGEGGGAWKTTESALPIFFPAQGSDIVARLSGKYRQLGEGEPSLTNYRPFEPWLTSGQTLSARMKGVNLLDPKRIVDGLIANGVPENEVGLTNGGFWLKSRNNAQNFFPDLQDVFKPNTRYTLSFNGFLGEGHGPTSYFSLRFEYTDGTTTAKSTNSSIQRTVLTSVANKTVSRISIIFYNGTNWTANLTEMMLTEGIVETAFEPYFDPFIINQTVSETIYSGVLSTDGKSLITHSHSVFDGSEAWSISNTSLIQTERFRLALNGPVKDSGYSSHFKTLPAPGADEPMVFAETNYVYIRIPAATIGVVHEDPDATKVAAFKSWLAAQHAAGTPVTFAYEVPRVSTPTEDLGLKAGQWGWYKRPVTYLVESNAAPTISVDYIEDATYQANSLQPLLRSNTNLTDEFMWDGGYRYFPVERNIADTPMQSGHQWLYDLSEGNNPAENTLYSTNGVLQIRGGTMTVLSALYTNTDMPQQFKLSFGMSRWTTPHWPRCLFLKYIDSNNKLWLDAVQYSLSLKQMVDGITSTLATTPTNSLSAYHLVNEQYQIYYYFSSSGRKRIKVLLNDSVIIDHDLDAETGNLFAVPTPFRIESGGTTSIANLMVRDLQFKY